MSAHYDLTAATEVSLNDHSDDNDIDLQAAIDSSLSHMNESSSSSKSSIPTNAGASRCDSTQTDLPVKGKRSRAPSPTAITTADSGGKRSRTMVKAAATKIGAKPLLFRLISTPSDAPELGTVSLKDLLSGEFTEALLCNYMIDMNLLLQAQPRLASVPVVLVHGFESDSEKALGLRKQCQEINAGIKLHHPELGKFGTHHAKLMVLRFALGIRVVITTANFTEEDVTSKSQGVWYQEFPLRQSETCDFENHLVEYLGEVGGPAEKFASTLRQYDFKSANVAIVASVPGTAPKHQQEHLEMWGHMRVRALLENERVLLKDGNHKVSFQFSSFASLSSKPSRWLMEMLTSFMAQKDSTEEWKMIPQKGEGIWGAALPPASADEREVLNERLQLVWPTTEAIRTSTTGWMAGGSIPCRTNDMFGGGFNFPDIGRFERNEPVDEIKPLLRKWEGNPAVNRTRNAPHIKTYVRYRERGGSNGQGATVDGDEVAWFLLTSSNLSRAAWGFLNKSSTQLLVRSFEMGVMFLPSLLGEAGNKSASEDECDGDGAPEAFTCTPGEMGLTQRLPLTHSIPPGKALPLELLPLPYRFPAPPYKFAEGDRPWVWDRSYDDTDDFGILWHGIGRN